MKSDDSTIQWLLESDHPPVRYLTLTELLGLSSRSKRVREAQRQIARGQQVQDLLTGQQEDGGFGSHPYSKWRGAHWRLVSLVELGIARGHPQCLAAVEQVLKWLTSPTHQGKIRTINGRTRRCASQEGNALGVCCCLGMAADCRVQLLAQSLIEWQWPDGGWNCDKKPEAHHSSFHESLRPMWGLIQYHRATGESSSLSAAQRTAELLLEHHLFRSSTTGEITNEEWTKLHWPAYWHYDVLGALDVLRLLEGTLADSRAAAALDMIGAQRLANGKWRHTGRRYWKRPGSEGKPASGTEVTDWGSSRKPSKMLTLKALRVLWAADRVS